MTRDRNHAATHPDTTRRRWLCAATTRHLPTLAILAAVLLAACSAQPVFRAEALHATGRFDDAAHLLDPHLQDKDNDGSPDGVQGHNTLWAYLEHAKMLQDAGRFQDSADAFGHALRVFEQLDELPSISLAGAVNNTTAILTDERNRDYLGAYHDRNAALTAQTVNMLMLNRPSEAAAYARQLIDSAAHTHHINERVQRTRDNLDDNDRDTPDVTTPHAHTAELRHPTLARRAARLKETSANHTPGQPTPYDDLVGALAMIAAGNPAEANDFLDRLATTHPDLAGQLAEHATHRSPDRLVIILFENGLAPARTDGSIRLAGLTVVPLPKLITRDRNRAEHIAIDNAVHTQQLTSIDALAAADFHARIAEIWGRPILSQTIKAASGATAFAFTDNQSSPIDELIALATAIWLTSAKPDLRSWRTLPAEQHAAIFDHPGDRQLTLELRTHNAQPARTVTLTLPDQTAPVVIYARSTSTSNLTVHVNQSAVTPLQQANPR